MRAENPPPLPTPTPTPLVSSKFHIVNEDRALLVTKTRIWWVTRGSSVEGIMDTQTWEQRTVATGFGLVANLISFGIFLAPVATFVRIYRTKTTGNIPSLPYLVGLFGCLLWLHYGFQQPDGVLIISINAAGAVIEIVYIMIFIFYAPAHTRRLTIILLLIAVVGLFFPIFLAIQFIVAKKNRVTILGWICTSVSIASFAAPLSAVRRVVRTRSVESMPIALTGSLICSGTVWLLYGFLVKNIYIYLPNVIGLTLGAIQLVVYYYYSSSTGAEIAEEISPVDLEVGGDAAVATVELVEQDGRLVEVAEASASGVSSSRPLQEDGVISNNISAAEVKDQDAWLDSVEIDPSFAGLSSAATKDEEEVQKLSSKDVAIMKRRIANVLEPEETVLQCLTRLQGSGDRKAKMTDETKIVFDQLTEDAMKLMENGESDVYHEKKDVFEREAEEYEELARARGEGTSSPLPSAGDFDMLADDDDAANKPSTDENNAVIEPSSDATNSGTEGGALPSDYVYDESSGYYYINSLGYYYDPNTALYRSAESGKWYSFNEETGTYDEIPEVSSN